MAALRRSGRVVPPAAGISAEKEKEKRPAKEDVKMPVLDEQVEKVPFEAEIAKLRERWELASVINFLTVFEPVIGKVTKCSAEEIEMGLITPNGSLAKLHIALLKGIPPVSKTLDVKDAWVTVLCKKLAPWWPWVAEGKIPVKAAKGEEIGRYKGLDPTKRLLMLKALCEIRADQDDILDYINDALKEGTEVSLFRKDRIGGDEKGTSYWYDGNTIIGHRLYKEVSVLESKTNVQGKRCSEPNISFQWETLATNLEQFQKVIGELSSSKVSGECDVADTIEIEAIPALVKLQKKKERELKMKQRQERQLNFVGAGTTRSCRNRRPVNYTFDDYDRAIHEAIKVSNKRKPTEEKNQERKRRNDTPTNDAPEKHTNPDSEKDSEKKSDLGNSGDNIKDESLSSDTETDMPEDIEDDSNWNEGTKDEDNDNEEDDVDYSDEDNSKIDKNHAQTDKIPHKLATFGARWSSRLAGNTNYEALENKNLGAKNRSRQRPVCNSALDTAVVQDSEDENSEGHDNIENSGRDIPPSPSSDPEEISES